VRQRVAGLPAEGLKELPTDRGGLKELPTDRGGLKELPTKFVKQLKLISL